MPAIKQFKSAELYHATLFHELIHATGHTSRLGRELTPYLMSRESYGKKELIAEVGRRGSATIASSSFPSDQPT